MKFKAMINLVKAQKVAEEAVLKAGQYQKDQFLKKHSSWDKANQNINIKEDLVSEKIITDILRKEFPKHRIYSEEAGYLGNKKSDYLWIVDPLDGTTNYFLNLPLFCTQLALTYNKKLLLSVIYQPLLKTMLSSIKNQGARLNNKKVSVTKTKSLKKSIISFERGYYAKNKNWIPQMIRRFAPLCRKYRLMSCAGLDFFSVACGMTDGSVFYGASVYDTTPGVLAVKEAGGVVTDEKGSEWNFDSQFMVASNGKIHKKLLKLLN